jgi:hypothetical protein
VGYRFDPEKDAWLHATRGLGFEAIIAAIAAGDLLRVVANPRYPGQDVLEVLVTGSVGGRRDDVYRVPVYREADGTVWLITLYPSRRATRAHRKASEA